eukprot:CAMPEP_0115106572 /NCGR_PEP_ID=MMETSP0227-20121206/36748_1 /TAXON_ID=89957 /ORGANISM="Polarella glacialis, Strain CCMP 1383" /LENGTH=161 /DNA_ID=CAMNT_0002504221 /DNA_START=76 /DNA_END=561 /DNA_ORIENTATION=+
MPPTAMSESAGEDKDWTVCPPTAQNLAARAESAGEFKDWEIVSSSAFTALDGVDKSALQELKSYARPPAGLITVMKAALMALGHSEKDVSWAAAKKLMSSPDTMNKAFRDFDLKSIDAKMMANLKRFAEDPDSQPDVVMKKGKACVGVALWVLAVYEYGSQ